MYNNYGCIDLPKAMEKIVILIVTSDLLNCKYFSNSNLNSVYIELQSIMNIITEIVHHIKVVTVSSTTLLAPTNKRSKEVKT